MCSGNAIFTTVPYRPHSRAMDSGVIQKIVDINVERAPAYYVVRDDGTLITVQWHQIVDLSNYQLLGP